MVDREALAAALEVLSDPGALAPRDAEPYWLSPKTVDLVVAAARERLAQLPEKCEHGQTVPHWAGFDENNHWTCPGKVYPAELVERIARVVNELAGAVSEEAVAVAVLDALNGETP